MKRDDHIDPLLHLYRAGELSAAEQARVEEHVKNCVRCAEIQQRLLRMDVSLAPMRVAHTEERADESLIAAVMQDVRKPSRLVDSPAGGEDWLGALLGWARPSFAAFALGLALLLAYQQSRDAMKLAKLEQHLHTRGVAELARRPAELSSAGEALASLPRAAAIGSESYGLLRSLVRGIGGTDDSFFKRFASRYPNLARVNPDDGIDEREQLILNTEGRAFARELEQLFQYQSPTGVRQP